MIVFFWNSLSELQKGSNFGLRRPLQIIRNFMERAGIDITALASRSEELSRPPMPTNDPPICGIYPNDSEHNANSRNIADHIPLGTEGYSMMHPDMLTDNMDWLDGSINSLNESDDMLYGLFRAS